MDLSSIPAVDQHAHNVLKPGNASKLSYAASFTESHDPSFIDRHARHTFFFRRSLRDVAPLLDCDATEPSVTKQRELLGLDELASRCFHAAQLDALLLDDGFLPNETLPLSWHQQFLPVVRRLLRIEWLAEQLLATSTSFDDFLDQFRATLQSPGVQTVAFKSIAAYRTGLGFDTVSHADAKSAFDAVDREHIRLTDKRLVDFFFAQTLEVAAQHQIPIQLHTGFGDPDLDLRLANPLHLRPWLEDRRFRSVPIILLHASYPFSREAGYLASVYPQVYVDCGLAIPLLSVTGMRQVVSQLLELAPFSKLMYSSDAHFIPDLFFLASKWARQSISHVLEQAVQLGDLSASEADEAALALLAGNARTVYRLDA